eukprot:scpid67834/ scgid31860/ 
MNIISLDGCLDGNGLPDLVEVAEYEGDQLERNGKVVRLPGSKLIVLGRKAEEALQIQHEKSGSDIAVDSLEKSRTFCILSPEARFDAVAYEAVEDIMMMAESMRPRYVMATRSWMSESGDCDARAGDVFRVGTRMAKNSAGELCIAWERCHSATNATPVQWRNYDHAESRPAKLGFSAPCRFMASAEDTLYTLSALEQLVRDKKLQLPVRLQEVHKSEGPAVRRRKYCLTGTKIVQWMLALWHDPGPTAGVHELVKIEMSTSLSRAIKVFRPAPCNAGELQKALHTFIMHMHNTDLASFGEIKVRPGIHATVFLPPLFAGSVPGSRQSSVIYEPNEDYEEALVPDASSTTVQTNRDRPAEPLPATHVESHACMGGMSSTDSHLSTDEAAPYLDLGTAAVGKFRSRTTALPSPPSHRNAVGIVSRPSNQMPASPTFPSQEAPQLPPRSPTCSRGRMKSP